VFDLLRETWAYVRTSKKWWLMPLIVVLLLMALLVIVLEGAPFLYPLF